ncbi:MAG: acyl-CoA dehydrogenase family protein [Ferrovibrionaceae bacterium]
MTLTEEQRQIRDTVRRFVEREVMPYEPVLIRREIEGGGASPGLTDGERRDLQEKGRAIGFWGIDLPAAYGGADLDPVTLAIIHEELGRTIVDFDFGGSVLPALFSCNEAQKERYLLPTINGERISSIAITEPGSGSDAMGMRTTAIRDGDSWVINGEKCWITRGDTADYAILFARTPQEGPRGGITCFLVDRAAGYTSAPIALMGSRDKVGSIHFADVRVPLDAVLGEVNKGFEHAMPFIYRNRGFILSAKNLGAMARMIEMAIDWARQRTVFGKKLAERENIAFAIAESEIELRAAKLLVHSAAAKAAAGADYRHEACATKVFVARAANAVADRALQIHGALGYAKESVIERWYRDLRVERIYDGSDEINLASLARNLFKGHAKAGDALV